MTTQRMLTLTMEIGREMLVSGAEVARVEDTITRICSAYGCSEINVFTITSSIVVTVRGADGEILTQTRRVSGYSTDLDRLDQLNGLSRRICAQTPDEQEVASSLQRILARPNYSLGVRCLASAGSAAAFTAFFGGGIWDMAVSALLGVVLRLCMAGLERVKSNTMFSNYITAFVVGLLAILSVRAGLGQDYEKIIIGNIMLLISGAAFFNSLRDIIAGDMMAGILRLCEAVVLAVFLAAGVATAILLTGVMGL